MTSIYKCVFTFVILSSVYSAHITKTPTSENVTPNANTIQDDGKDVTDSPDATKLADTESSVTDATEDVVVYTDLGNSNVTTADTRQANDPTTMRIDHLRSSDLDQVLKNYFPNFYNKMVYIIYESKFKDTIYYGGLTFGIIVLIYTFVELIRTFIEIFNE